MRDAESLQEFMRVHGAALARFAYLFTGSHDQADDLVRAALVKVVPRWSRIVRDRPDAYLRRIIYRERISLWRRRRFGEYPLHEAPEPVVGEKTARVELRLATQWALARLTVRQRAVVILRYYEERPEQETAQILDVTAGTVNSQARQALARLHVMLPELRLDDIPSSGELEVLP